MKNIFSVTLVIFCKCLTAQIITTFAGNGTIGFSGDGGPATQAQLYYPKAICFDAIGNLYITDWNNYRIRKVDLSGNISTIVGNLMQTYSGDGGLATAASIGVVHDIAIDATGNIYFPDFYFHVVRKINTNGIITTIAGNGNSGHSGDGSAATSAQLDSPVSVAVDNGGNIYIAEMQYIRKITPAGIITTIAGNPFAVNPGNNGPAISASFSYPKGLIADPSGNIYFSDQSNNQIRKITLDGMIHAFAGTGTQGYSGDGDSAIYAQINTPYDLAFDAAGNLLIADYGNHVIRMVNSAGIISTVAGNGIGAGTVIGSYSGDGGPVLNAGFNVPSSIAVDAQGRLYICDGGNNRIRKTDIGVGIMEKNESEHDISIFPVPFNEKITVIYSAKKEMPIQIFNALGSVIYSSLIILGKIEIDLSNQPPGIYFIRVEDKTKKIIKE